MNTCCVRACVCVCKASTVSFSASQSHNLPSSSEIVDPFHLCQLLAPAPVLSIHIIPVYSYIIYNIVYDQVPPPPTQKAVYNCTSYSSPSPLQSFTIHAAPSILYYSNHITIPKKDTKGKARKEEDQTTNHHSELFLD